jgi:hypothetical protein
LPRSIVAWFVVCWGFFLVAALVVGAMLVGLYKETTSQRTERAAASLGRACEAIVREFRAPLQGGAVPVAGVPDYLSPLTRALEPFTGVEGGLWKATSGSLAYAFPTYEGSGKKTDLPQAEEPTIREVVGTAIGARRPVEWSRDARSQILLIRACPLDDAGSGISAWTMTRVITVGGRPFLGDGASASRFLSDVIETMIRRGQRSRLALSNRAISAYRRFRSSRDAGSEQVRSSA